METVMQLFVISKRVQPARPDWSFVAAAVVAGWLVTAGVASAQPASAPSHMAGRILLMPKAGLPDHALARVLSENGAGKARRIGGTALRIVEVPAGAEASAVLRLARHPHIKFAELDRQAKPDAAPNDPYFGSQWHLAKTGAPGAWDRTMGAGVTIAILDTGVDATHPDLAPQLVSGWNFVTNTSNTSDVYNHGTGVAGAAAAAINNAVGVAGMAGQARVMPIKISDDSGYGSWSAMAQGLIHAADRGARVANISFSSAAHSASVLSAAQYMKSRGGLVFVSAGNTGTSSTAAPTADMIVVGATNPDDTRRSSSTFGPVVSIAAPGTSVYTTTKGGGYVAENGTSFASPVAAGVAALVMAANPSLTGAQVEDVLFRSAVDLGATGRDDWFGHGRVDAAQAVQLALGTTGAPIDTQPPVVSLLAPASGSTVSGIVSVTLSASDDVGVARVEFRVNGRVVAVDDVAPFGFAWDSASVPNGSVEMSLVAYDASGNATSSPASTVSVYNVAAVDLSPPSVTISNPADGAAVSGRSLKVAANATDDRGVEGIGMTLAINGVVVASSAGSGTLNYTWNTRGLAAGSYALTVTARDAAGNLASRSVTVTATAGDAEAGPGKKRR